MGMTYSFEVYDYNTKPAITTMFDTIDEALSALREVKHNNGILHMEVIHNQPRRYRFDGTTTDCKELVYIMGKLKVLTANTLVNSRNFHIRIYQVKHSH